MLDKERGYLYHLRYYIAWSCYQQQELLTETNISMLKQYLEESCNEKEIVVCESEITPSYVYLVIECKPKHIIPVFLKGLKGGSAKQLLKQGMRTDSSEKTIVWDGLNIISTEPNVLEAIKEYVSKKKK